MAETTCQEVKIYRQKNLIFELGESEITVKTSHVQFYLIPKSHYWKRRLNLIRTMIQLGEIRSLNELAEYCARGSIEWIAKY